MSLKYKVITCSKDSRYPQDLVLTLRFVGEAPDAHAVICIVEDAPDLLGALEDARNKMVSQLILLRCDEQFIKKETATADAAIAKARGEA